MAKSLLRSLVAVAAFLALPLTAAVVPQPSHAAGPPELNASDEIAIRGTVVAFDPVTKWMVLESPERDTLGYRALPTMGWSGDALKRIHPGVTVDIRYYRIVDMLAARTTPEVDAKAAAMLKDPAQAPGILGTNQRVGLWEVQGMVVRTDPAAMKMDIVNPAGGMVYRTPWLKSAEGQALVMSAKPGDFVTLVFSERTAFEVKPVE